MVSSINALIIMVPFNDELLLLYTLIEYFFQFFI